MANFNSKHFQGCTHEGPYWTSGFPKQFLYPPQSESGRKPAGGESLSPGWAWQPEHLSVIGIIIYLDRKGILRFFWSPKS